MFTSAAACIDWALLGARVLPLIVAVPNPEIAPTLVPMSPVIMDGPLLDRAPSAVNSAKPAVVPRLGASVCPKLILVNVSRVATVKISKKVFLIILSSINMR